MWEVAQLRYFHLSARRVGNSLSHLPISNSSLFLWLFRYVSGEICGTSVGFDVTRTATASQTRRLGIPLAPLLRSPDEHL